MRTGGVWNREMARRHLWSGPQIGRTSPWSRTVTSLGTSSPLVSEAGRQRGCLGASLCHGLTFWLSLVSAFQPSSWVTRFWVMGRTSPSPSEWTDGTLASLRKISCLRELAWEFRCPWSPRAIPILVRLLWSTSSGETVLSVNSDLIAEKEKVGFSCLFYLSWSGLKKNFWARGSG